MASVLIVDDEAEIVELIDFYMKNNGYKVYKAYNGQEALNIFEREEIDIVLLDIMIPVYDGKEVLRRIRQTSHVPVLFLSAKGEDLDKIEGLFLGADDYLSKPFNPMELIARVQAVLRRSQIVTQQENRDYLTVIKDLRLDEKSCKLYKEDIDLKLTALEYKLIAYFMKNKNRVFTKTQLYEAVWEEAYFGDENIIMVYISKLRDKIEEHPKEPQFIKTIRGLGYIFEGD
jgi:DNA-binding response OmpR family regulator